MASFLNDNDDLLYYLQDGLDWAALAALCEQGFKLADGWKNADEARGFYKDVAGLVGELAAEEVAPHAAQIDREGIRFEKGEAVFPPRLKAIHDRIAEQGLHGMILPRDLGGMNAPVLLHFICEELLARADVSVMTHYGFHGGMALAMLALSRLEGSTEIDAATGKVARTRWPAEISEVAAGKAWGSMDITEPDAGSDMAALRMVGEQTPAGGWTVTGQKIFITSGHGKYHFVIARTEKPSGPDDPKGGLGGLSMFLVRAFRDEPDGSRTRLATLDRIEEKLGHHGSATVAITFDHTPGDLVGRPGEGFRQMLEIMNHARLGVGFESIGLCEAALRMARAYAAERRSMGKTLDHHEMIADYLDEMETDIVGLRALAMHGAYHDELAQKMTLHGSGEAAELAAHKAAARRATPLLKYLAAEKAVEMARRNLQIHGGNGYMREFGAEKLLRDALVMPIYEGTSQIQALMAMKDTLGTITRSPQAFVKRVAQTRWRALSARDALERRVARLQQLSLGAQQHLITRTMAVKMKSEPMGRWGKTLFGGQLDPKRDFAHALLHAERLTRILADEQIAEVLLAQARRHPQRREWLERYLDRAEPRARALADEIATTGTRLLARLAPPSESKAAG
jgi:alkylation response protein AidB-like acyl-CoA dehydrogenase